MIRGSIHSTVNILIASAVACLLSAAAAQHAETATSTGVFEQTVDVGSPIEVGVTDPRGRFMFLQTTEFRCPGTTFEKGTLSIDVKNAVGIRWVNGKKVTNFVFPKPGKYKVLVSDNLETELDNSYSNIFELQVSGKDLQRAKRTPSACLDLE